MMSKKQDRVDMYTKALLHKPENISNMASVNEKPKDPMLTFNNDLETLPPPQRQGQRTPLRKPMSKNGKHQNQIKISPSKNTNKIVLADKGTQASPEDKLIEEINTKVRNMYREDAYQYQTQPAQWAAIQPQNLHERFLSACSNNYDTNEASKPILEKRMDHLSSGFAT